MPRYLHSDNADDADVDASAAPAATQAPPAVATPSLLPLQAAAAVHFLEVILAAITAGQLHETGAATARSDGDDRSHGDEESSSRSDSSVRVPYRSRRRDRRDDARRSRDRGDSRGGRCGDRSRSDPGRHRGNRGGGRSDGAGPSTR